MYPVVVTEGIVLGKRGVGEANTLVTILSESRGLMQASARSARLGRSKLRYGLESLSCARYSLVRGKYEWKLTGVEGVSRELLSPYIERRVQAGRIGKLLLRLLTGEEPVPALYLSVREGLQCLARVEEHTAAEAIECVLVLRILAHLGYLPKTMEIAPFLEQDFFSLELAAAAARSRPMLVKRINESLGATGL